MSAGFRGYLIKLKARGNYAAEELPLKYMGIGSYSCTPNQRMESSANRATDGVLHRTTVSHTATKIEFDTPNITNEDVADLNKLLQHHMTNRLQRKISIEYYDPENDEYKSADCYMPDVQYKINSIVEGGQYGKILYTPIRYAFIEY